ncbi:unnamed protein product [Sphagnum balticum]
MCSLVGEAQVVSAGRRIPSSEAIKWLSRPVRILVYWPAVHCRYPQHFLQSPAALPSAQSRSEIKCTPRADSDGKKMILEKLWQEFFVDPSQWWDNRPEKEALALSQQMQQEGVEPDPVTFIGILNACASLRALEEGKCIHEQIIKSSFDSNVNVTTRIINMYVKCGSMEDAFKVFHSMPARDVVVWNVMILGYVKYGQGQKALVLYEEMQHEGVKPNSVTFVVLSMHVPA